MTLVEFLLARIAEDVAAAGAVSGATVVGERGNWQPAPGGDEWAASLNPGAELEVLVALRPGLPRPPDVMSGFWGQVVVWSGDAAFDYGREPDEYLAGRVPIAEFIARHDPARVLAECAAQRAVVEYCAALQTPGLEPDYDDGARDTAWEVLRRMTWPYATHPAFDPAWR